MSGFSNPSIVKQANVYFYGNVSGRTIKLPMAQAKPSASCCRAYTSSGH